MPSNYEYSYFSQDVYKDHSDPPPGWRILRESNAEMGRNGYFGRAYINETTNEIVVAHRGTEFNKDASALLSNMAPVPHYAAHLRTSLPEGDLKSDGQIGFGMMPQQSSSANAFNIQIKEAVHSLPNASQYDIHQTGHSLGGYLAQIESARHSSRATTFDNPGVKIEIDRMLSNGEISPEQYKYAMENIQSFQASDNFVNSKGHSLLGEEPDYSIISNAAWGLVKGALTDNSHIGKVTKLDHLKEHAINGFTNHFKPDSGEAQARGNRRTL